MGSGARWTKVYKLKVVEEHSLFSTLRYARVVDEIAATTDDLQGIKFVKIKKIEILPSEQIYDIEVEGTHNFIGNDIVVHNTYISATTTIMGNVGIGTTSPTALLHLSSTAAQDLFRIDDNGPGDTSPFVIDQNGNVGINTTSPGAYALNVVGQCVTGDTRLRRRRKKSNSKPDVVFGLTSGFKQGEDDEYIYDEVQIKDINPGDEIASLNEKTGQIVWSRVQGLMDMGVKPIYELITEDGKSIRTTGNHPYLVKTSSAAIGIRPQLNLSNVNSSIFEDKFNPPLSNSESEIGQRVVSQSFSKSQGIGRREISLEFLANEFRNFGRKFFQIIFSFLGNNQLVFHYSDFLNFCFISSKEYVLSVPAFNSLSNFSRSFLAQARYEGLNVSISSIVSSNSNLADGVSFQFEASAKEINPSNLSNKSLGSSGLLNPPANDFGFQTILSFLSRAFSNLINSSFTNSRGLGAIRSFDRDKILGNEFTFAIQNNDNKKENSLSNTKWVKVYKLKVVDEIAVTLLLLESFFIYGKIKKWLRKKNG